MAEAIEYEQFDQNPPGAATSTDLGGASPPDPDLSAASATYRWS